MCRTRALTGSLGLRPPASPATVGWRGDPARPAHAAGRSHTRRPVRLREVPVTTPAAELSELGRRYPTELRSEDGVMIWFSRLPRDDRWVSSSVGVVELYCSITSTNSATTRSSPSSVLVRTIGSNDGFIGSSVMLSWSQESSSVALSLRYRFTV